MLKFDATTASGAGGIFHGLQLLFRDALPIYVLFEQVEQFQPVFGESLACVMLSVSR